MPEQFPGFFWQVLIPNGHIKLATHDFANFKSNFWCIYLIFHACLGVVLILFS